MHLKFYEVQIYAWSCVWSGCLVSRVDIIPPNLSGYHQRCHQPNIPASALEFDAPWMCVYCSVGALCPYLENPFESKTKKTVSRKRRLTSVSQPELFPSSVFPSFFIDALVISLCKLEPSVSLVPSFTWWNANIPGPRPSCWCQACSLSSMMSGVQTVELPVFYSLRERTCSFIGTVHQMVSSQMSVTYLFFQF